MSRPERWWRSLGSPCPAGTGTGSAPLGRTCGWDRPLPVTAQGCVGGQREWSVVFADHLPLERRAEDVARLVAKAELVVVHGSQV